METAGSSGGDLMHKCITTVKTMAILSHLLGIRAMAQSDETMQVWKNITIARIRILETSFVEPYAQIYGENSYVSGYPDVAYQPGRYASTYEVLEVLAGDESIQGKRLETNPYDTREYVSHNAILSAVDPPFQPGEEIVLPLVRYRDMDPAFRWFPSAWNYLRLRSQPAVARPRTTTYREDLRVMNELAKVLKAKGEQQDKLIRALLTGDHPGLATWAIYSLLKERQLAAPGSEIHRRVARMLQEVATAPVEGLTHEARWKVLNELTSESMIEEWLTFFESVATADYTRTPRPVTVLDHVQKAAEFAMHQESHKAVRTRVLELYALTLANTSLPADLRERRVGQVIQQPDLHRNAGLTDQQAFEVLLEVLRYSQEAAIELAVAESIRDDLRLTPARQASLEAYAEYVETEEAALIIQAMLNR